MTRLCITSQLPRLTEPRCHVPLAEYTRTLKRWGLQQTFNNNNTTFYTSENQTWRDYALTSQTQFRCRVVCTYTNGPTLTRIFLSHKESNPTETANEQRSKPDQTRLRHNPPPPPHTHTHWLISVVACSVWPTHDCHTMMNRGRVSSARPVRRAVRSDLSTSGHEHAIKSSAWPPPLLPNPPPPPHLHSRYLGAPRHTQTVMSDAPLAGPTLKRKKANMMLNVHRNHKAY